MRLILLGTGGGPRISPLRSRPANLIVAGGIPYVIDCGEGVAVQLVRAGIALNTLRYIFITHQHSDHNLDYGNLINDAWTSGLTTPIDAYGPPPLRAMTRAYWEYVRYDIETRIRDEGRPDLRKLVAVHEFDKAGVVMENADVKVTSARVIHPAVTQAYAYRFDGYGRSIVFSGDTAYSQDLITLARNADVLVHEALHPDGIELVLQRNPNAATLRSHLLASHTVPEDVGKVAAAAGVKTLVLSHLVPSDDPSLPPESWISEVRKHFNGQIVFGQDLMEI